jgi:hypothetical protein
MEIERFPERARYEKEARCPFVKLPRSRYDNKIGASGKRYECLAAEQMAFHDFDFKRQLPWLAAEQTEQRFAALIQNIHQGQIMVPSFIG